MLTVTEYTMSRGLIPFVVLFLKTCAKPKPGFEIPVFKMGCHKTDHAVPFTHSNINSNQSHVHVFGLLKKIWKV